jgi:hypothetical protein
MQDYKQSSMAKKNKAAVQLGRKGGNATAKKWKSTPERKEIARKAAQARWAKEKKAK